ncbi:unnamed protein product [Nezara viridula]|uniref:Neuropeptide n=1 Tax=Nezara viridula TaxID=85310 RepID=A0A9P0DZK8_NEZVI|nr:unnamed protein product [Nezara viridula]
MEHFILMQRLAVLRALAPLSISCDSPYLAVLTLSRPDCRVLECRQSSCGHDEEDSAHGGTSPAPLPAPREVRLSPTPSAMVCSTLRNLSYNHDLLSINTFSKS